MNYAYVTVITSDQYLLGVLALRLMLRLARACYPLIVLIGDDVSLATERTLRSHRIDTIRIQSVCVPNLITTLDSNHYWKNTLTKLKVFSLCQFDKIVYLDCDIMILRNIDALFERPHMSAVGHMRFPDKRDWIGLNSGVMVVVPRDGLCESLEQSISEAAATRPIFGDQDVIQMYYKDWNASAELHLDEGYNIYIGGVDYYAEKLGYRMFSGKNKINVIHFIGPQKPWMMGLSQRARHLYNLLRKRRKYQFSLFIIYIATLWALRIVIRPGTGRLSTATRLGRGR